MSNPIHADNGRTIFVPSDDIARVYNVLKEAEAFLAEASNYGSAKQIDSWLGLYRKPAAYKAISNAFYRTMLKWMPPDICQQFDERD
jgi:hypothetical protein